MCLYAFMYACMGGWVDERERDREISACNTLRIYVLLNILVGSLYWNIYYCFSWEQTSDMKCYHSEIAYQINKIDITTITADNHEVSYVPTFDHSVSQQL